MGVFGMDETMMRLALKEAMKSGDDVPIAALVEKNGLLIALAHNRRERDSAPFAHAEMLAMDAACKLLNTRRLSGCTLYVTLEPCPMCAGAMIMAGLDRCVFGAFDSDYGCCGSLYALPQDSHFSHRVQVIGGVLEEEAAALLKDFFATHRDLR
jgi:tRNA(adenine34) deaminase